MIDWWIVVLWIVLAFAGGFDVGVLFMRWMRDGRAWLWNEPPE